MKKALFAFSAVFILVIVFASCKKEDNANQPQSVKILGKWNVVSSILHEKYMGADYYDTTKGMAGDYLEFQPGGIVKTRITEDGEPTENTAGYFMPNDQTVSVVSQGDTSAFTIKTLTGNSLVLYSRYENTGGDFFSETTIDLKK